MKKFLIVLAAVPVLSVFPADAGAQYKDFQKSDSKQEYFSISFYRQSLWLGLYTGEEKVTSRSISTSDIQISADHIRLTDDFVFERAGLSYKGIIYEYDKVSAAKIIQEKDSVTILFYRFTDSDSGTSRKTRGNIITFSEPITVEPDAFVRGALITIRGNININGEVNKDIISLFGNIGLTTGAVARGDIASITGEIEIEEQASIYGEILSGTRKIDSRQFKFYREHELAQGLKLNFNRVDGLLLGMKLNFEHKDSLIPAINAGLGYAFESKRMRYSFEAEQYIWKKYLLRIGGGFYRKMSSGDDWLLGNGENTAFALTATEDFKDYYETEGAGGWIKIEPARNFYLKTGYQNYDTRWFNAQKHLWSMFGGNKLFRENFGSVDPAYRALGIMEIDSSHNGTVSIEFSYDNRHKDEDRISSGWQFLGNFEWADNSFSSDFNYRKYAIQAVRFLRISRVSSLRLRAVHGNSDGYLPMYKKYFLGGLGTLQGYEHKEMIGTRFWMFNSEYWVGLTKLRFSNLIFMWDAGQIANDSKLDDRTEIKHSVGLGLDLSGLRVNFSKRLDGRQKRDIKIHVRFAASF